LILSVDVLFEARAQKRVDTLRGPMLAYGMCGFFIVVALVTTHWAIVGASIGVTAVLFAIVTARLARDARSERVRSGDPQALP
jgi:hypothetical protein